MGEDMSTGRAKAKAKKKCTNQTIPLCKAFHALQSLDILARALQRSSPIKSSGTVLVVIIVMIVFFILFVFFDVCRRSIISFVAPIEQVGVAIEIRRMRIRCRSLSNTAIVGGVVARAPAARRVGRGRRR